MGASFNIFKKEGVLVIAVDGDPTVDDIKAALDQTRDSKGYSSLSRLWDFREASFDFSMEEIEEISAHAASADVQTAKLAMLVGHDLSFGVSRMYEAYRKNSLTDVKVFRTEPEAISWLLE